MLQTSSPESREQEAKIEFEKTNDLQEVALTHLYWFFGGKGLGVCQERGYKYKYLTSIGAHATHTDSGERSLVSLSGRLVLVCTHERWPHGMCVCVYTHKHTHAHAHAHAHAHTHNHTRTHSHSNIQSHG